MPPVLLVMSMPPPLRVRGDVAVEVDRAAGAAGHLDHVAAPCVLLIVAPMVTLPVPPLMSTPMPAGSLVLPIVPPLMVTALVLPVMSIRRRPDR